MSEQQTPVEGTSAPVEEAQASTATPEAATQEKPRVKADDLPPDALKARLEQEQRKAREAVFAELGLTADEIKQLADEKRQREDAQKTLEQKLAERDAEIERERQRNAGFLRAIEERASYEMASLTQAQREAVEAISGDDPSAKLRAIDKLKPTWAAQSPVHEKPQGDSAPAPTAPGDSGATSPPDHRAIYEQLRQTNPVAASAYGNAHRAAVFGL